MEIKHIALDFGGVLGYIDLTNLTYIEKTLLEAYRHQNNQKYLMYLSNILKIDIPTLLENARSAISQIYFKAYKIYDSTPKTLESFLTLGFSLSIWTNNTLYFNKWINSNPISNYIPASFICNSWYYPENFNKPNPNFYEEALKQINLNPEEILFIDDSPPNIFGAQKLNINGLIYKHPHNLEKETITEILKLERRK